MTKKGVDSIGVVAGKSHHAAIKEITDRITHAVEDLYSDKPNRNASPSKAAVSHDKDSFNKFEDPEMVDLDTANWDMDASKLQVKNLLDNLKTQQRTKVMAELNQWFSDKSKLVQSDMASLEKLERERDIVEDALKQLHTEVETKLDEKEMHSFQVLHMFYRALHDISKRKREHADAVARGESIDDATRQARASLGLGNSELKPEGTLKDGLSAAEVDVQALRTELLAKEKEIATALAQLERGAVGENGEGPKASDLLLLISAQQDEINALGSRVEVNEKKIKVLRSALTYLQLGSTTSGEPPEDAVLAIIEEVKNKVREARIAELVSRKEQDEASIAARIPDEEEVLKLERECQELRGQLAGLEDEIRKFQKPSERERELREKLNMLQAAGAAGKEGKKVGSWLDEIKSTIEDGTISVESAPVLKKKLESELQRVAQENSRLQSQVTNYERLLATGEQTLKTMDEQRKLFLEAVEAARKALATQAIHAANAEVEAERLRVEESESRLIEEKTLKQSRAAQDNLLASLRQEEASLLKEIQALEGALTDSGQRLTEETQRQDKVASMIQQHSKTLNAAVSTDAATHAQELTKIQKQNETLLQEIQELTNKLTAQQVSAEEAAQSASASALKSFSDPLISEAQQKKAELSGQPATVTTTAPVTTVKPPVPTIEGTMPVVDNQKANTNVVATLAGLAKQVDAIKASPQTNWAAADMQELLKVQQENFELARQIELIEQRIRVVKSSKGSLDLSVLREGSLEGIADVENAEVPPENLELRKEVKLKQRTLHMLRKKWWAEKAAAEASAAAAATAGGILPSGSN